MGTSPDSLNDARLAEARQRLRRLARQEPWPLRLLEPERRPLIEAFLLGLAAGGLKPARRWMKWRVKKLLS